MDHEINDSWMLIKMEFLDLNEAHGRNFKKKLKSSEHLTSFHKIKVIYSIDINAWGVFIPRESTLLCDVVASSSEKNAGCSKLVGWAG